MKRLKYLHIIHAVRHLAAPISRNVRLRFLLVSSPSNSLNEFPLLAKATIMKSIYGTGH
jgi:hypothetical protein